MADAWRSISLQAHSIDYLEVIHHVPHSQELHSPPQRPLIVSSCHSCHTSCHIRSWSWRRWIVAHWEVSSECHPERQRGVMAVTEPHNDHTMMINDQWSHNDHTLVRRIASLYCPQPRLYSGPCTTVQLYTCTTVHLYTCTTWLRHTRNTFLSL